MKNISLFLLLSAFTISYAQPNSRPNYGNRGGTFDWMYTHLYFRSANGFTFTRGNTNHFKKFAQTGECKQCDLRDFNLAAAIEHFKSDAINSKKAIDLEGSDISGANLKKAWLWDANMKDVIAEGTDFSEAHLRETDFTGAYLKKSIFVLATADDVRFKNANLEEVNAFGMKLEKADISGANLSKINLSQAFALKANFESAKLDYANLSLACLIGGKFKDASLKSALLKNADLSFVDFDLVDVANAEFQQVKGWSKVKNKDTIKNFDQAKYIPKD